MLARAVCFHQLGRLHDRCAEAQQQRASGLALVTAAVALWNIVYLDRRLDAVPHRGEVIPDAASPRAAWSLPTAVSTTCSTSPAAARSRCTALPTRSASLMQATVIAVHPVIDSHGQRRITALPRKCDGASGTLFGEGSASTEACGNKGSCCKWLRAV